MIYLYTGTPGSGKSYHVAKDIFFYLSHGRNIITNFEIDESMITSKKRGRFTCLHDEQITIEYLRNYALEYHRTNARGQLIEGQTYLIIDECQRMFNCRSWNDKERQQWCTFFCEHRHFGFHVILVTQMDRLVDRQIRSLAEYEIKHRKINNFGKGGFLVTLFCIGRPVFVAIEYWYGAKERCGSTLMLGRNKYFSFYDSYKLFGEPARIGVAEGRGPLSVPAPEQQEKTAEIRPPPSSNRWSQNTLYYTSECLYLQGILGQKTFPQIGVWGKTKKMRICITRG